jgi:hypothetical protein
MLENSKMIVDVHISSCSPALSAAVPILRNRKLQSADRFTRFFAKEEAQTVMTRFTLTLRWPVFC